MNSIKPNMNVCIQTFGFFSENFGTCIASHSSARVYFLGITIDMMPNRDDFLGADFKARSLSALTIHNRPYSQKLESMVNFLGSVVQRMKDEKMKLRRMRDDQDSR